jgi:pseudouridine kinase
MFEIFKGVIILDKEEQILALIKVNPFITQIELALRLSLSRSAVAGYISQLVKKGKIVGRAYVIREDAHITCIGGAIVDRKAQSLETVQYQESNPVTITHSCGGVARNVAENLGRLGCSTALISVVGKDNEGKWLLNKTKLSGVDVSQSFVLTEGNTGNYTAILDKTGEMVIAINDMQIYQSLNVAMVEEKWPHIASSTLIMLDTNIPEQVLVYIIERCKEERLSLCINPVSAVKSKKLPADLQGVYLLLPNKNEMEVLTGMKIETISDCKRACERIMQKGVQQVVVSLGAQGIFWANEAENGHILPEKVEVVDVTGAGDALTAGVLFGLIQGESIETACRLGMISASFTLQTTQSVYNLSADLLYNKLEKQNMEESR